MQNHIPNHTDSPEYPKPESRDLTEPEESQKPPQSSPLPQDDKFKKFVLTRLERVMVKSIYRKFLGECRSIMFNNIKQAHRPLWKYQKLFSKPKTTPQQDMFKHFLSHCASKIQSTFQGFIDRLRYTTTRRIHQNLTKWVVGNKVRRVYNCEKVIEIRGRYNRLKKMIIGYKQGEGQSKVALQKQVNFARNMFSQQFEFLHSTGGWIYQKPPFEKKSQPIKSTQELPSPKEEEDRPIRPSKPRIQKREIAKEPQNPQSYASRSLSENEFMSNVQSERPITGKETYTMEDFGPLPSSETDAAIVKPTRTTQRKTVKKDKYDPRKAVLEDKKKKKEGLKTEPEATPVPPQQIPKQNNLPIPREQMDRMSESVEKSPGISSKRSFKEGVKRKQKDKPSVEKLSDKSFENPSVVKQTKSKIDCWNKSSVDYKKKKSREDAYYEQNRDSDQCRMPEYKDISRKQLHENITRNLQNIIEKMEENRIRRKRGLTLEDIEKAYQNQYLKRYSKLEPRLEELAFLRDQAYAGPIPYLLNTSEFADTASTCVMNQEFDILEYYLKTKEEPINQ